LGFGMLSVAPSSATVTAHTLSIDSATDAISTVDSATAVLTHQFVNLGGNEAALMDSVIIRAIVTSSNASNAGNLYFQVIDSYTSAGNDATTGNSPRYLAVGATDTATTSDQSRGTGSFSPANFDNTTGRNAIRIRHSTADRAIGSSIRLTLANIQVAGTYTVSVYTQTSAGGAAVVSATPSVTWTITATGADKTSTAASTVTLRNDQNACAVALPEVLRKLQIRRFLLQQRVQLLT